MINRHAVYHRPTSEYAYAEDERTLVVRLRTARGGLEECALFYGDRADEAPEPVFQRAQMRLAAYDSLFDWYEVRLSPVLPRVMYYFELRDADERVLYYAGRFFDKLPGMRLEGRWFDHRCEVDQFPYIRREDLFAVPEWFRNAVVYNIFPDSFANGVERLEKKETHILRAGVVSSSRLGGTLEGIRLNLDYIHSLGFNTLYLNPFFHAEAYHKYNTVDYYHVDPCMGSDADFARLCGDVHRRGMHILIDGVFNHCGANFFAFRDLLERQEASPYQSWFYGAPLPVARPPAGSKPGYDCFAYVESMPKLNTGDPGVRDYFCKVGAHWVREYGIDGWRLDVADEVDHRFWRAFHDAVKRVNPQAVLIAEAWEEARSFVCADQFTSAMNYDFRRCARDFIALNHTDAETMNDWLTALRMRYSEPAVRAQLNLIDSHDVPRFLSLCGGNTAKLHQAIALLMLIPGVPCLFYGDERGMLGVEENEYRRPMAWQERNSATEAFVRKAAGLRGLPETKAGQFQTLCAESGGHVLGFCLLNGSHRLEVWLNASDQEAEIPALAGNVLLEQGYQPGRLEAFGLVVARS